MSAEIAELEQQIIDLRELTERKDLALKLEKNPEFSKLILDGFCEKEAARFARESGDFAMPKEDRENALAMAQAAGHLRRYLSMCVTMGRQAEREIKQCQQAISELHQEGQS